MLTNLKDKFLIEISVTFICLENNVRFIDLDV